MVSSKLALFASALCAGLLLANGRPLTAVNGVGSEVESVPVSVSPQWQKCATACVDASQACMVAAQIPCRRKLDQCIQTCGPKSSAVELGAIPFTCDWDYENCMSTYQQTHSEFTKKYCMDAYQSCKDSVSTKAALTVAPSAAKMVAVASSPVSSLGWCFYVALLCDSPWPPAYSKCEEARHKCDGAEPTPPTPQEIAQAQAYCLKSCWDYNDVFSACDYGRNFQTDPAGCQRADATCKQQCQRTQVAATEAETSASTTAARLRARLNAGGL